MRKALSDPRSLISPEPTRVSLSQLVVPSRTVLSNWMIYDGGGGGSISVQSAANTAGGIEDLNF